ncbi:MAG: hypothetical protein IRZ02_07270 [Acidothermus sp.]|nr:hypothetical protein [Acidothermus sp.]MCL6538838.1 hypothetical protein [Acidothermus sp.]
MLERTATQQSGATSCRWCTDDLAHCHDPLVVHGTGTTECLSEACVVPAEAHDVTVCCAELGCPCAEPALADLPVVG